MGVDQSMAAGKKRLLDAAEQLFIERGTHEVSQQEILAAAGQRNQSAIQYHFGDMAGLRAAVFDRNLERINRERMEMLDRATAGHREPTIDDVVDAMILPLSRQLADGRSGRRYLRHLADAMRSPGARESQVVTHSQGLLRAHAYLRRLLHPMPASVLNLRLYVASWTVVSSLGEWDGERHDAQRTERLVAELRTMLAAMFTAPASDARRPPAGGNG